MELATAVTLKCRALETEVSRALTSTRKRGCEKTTFGVRVLFVLLNMREFCRVLCRISGYLSRDQIPSETYPRVFFTLE